LYLVYIPKDYKSVLVKYILESQVFDSFKNTKYRLGRYACSRVVHGEKVIYWPDIKVGIRNQYAMYTKYEIC